MAKAKTIKRPVNDKIPVEIVVIDDEEITVPSPVNDNVIHHDLMTDPVGQSHPVTVEEISENPSFSVEIQPIRPNVDVTPECESPPAVDKKIPEVPVDYMTDSVVNEKSVKTTSAFSRGIGETIHPMFVNCLLDKVRRMEEKMNEIVASRDLLRIDNQGLKEKVVASDQHLLRLRNHKNKLIRRVLKLQDENERTKKNCASLMLRLP